MFLLDTNVILELRKAKSTRIDPNVATWAAGAASGSLFLSAITVLELEMGILSMWKDTAQATMLREWFDGHVLPTFHNRILPVDTAVALQCAKLHVPDRRSERDALIAATALVHGLAVVTRNVADFAGTGVAVMNPWEPLSLPGS
jgi:predicted nucleic acid-binding protein